jgi:hypothetical protein
MTGDRAAKPNGGSLGLGIEAAPRAAPSDDGLYGRWQALQLLSPVYGLLERGAPRAGFDHTRYDLAQLALRAIDFVVANQATLEGSVTPDRVLDHLSQLARRMSPDDQTRPWSAVATLVLNSLLNDGRPHEATWRELAADEEEGGPEPKRYRFRLLRLVDSEDGTALAATDEAIVLYLQALSADLADQATALKLIVELQMNAGEFDKALTSARAATRTARALAASLRDKLDDTRRDVRSVDWHEEMPAWLSGVLGQVGLQLERDRQLKELAVRSGEDPGATAVCRNIVAEVRRSEDIWTRLENHLQKAIPAFLEAQQAQEFRPRGLAMVIDLVKDVFEPALGAGDELLIAGSQVLVKGVCAPVVDGQWGLDELCKVLLRAPATFERREPEVDDPGELGESIGDSIPDDVAAAAAAVFELAAARPVRLSELLAEARQLVTDVTPTPSSGTGTAGPDTGEQDAASGPEPIDADAVTDIVWGGALWAFVAEAEASEDDQPRRADLAAALAPLIALDDGTELDDPRYSGADLLLGTQLAFDLVEKEQVGPADVPRPSPGPVDDSFPALPGFSLEPIGAS